MSCEIAASVMTVEMIAGIMVNAGDVLIVTKLAIRDFLSSRLLPKSYPYINQRSPGVLVPILHTMRLPPPSSPLPT